MHLAVDPKDAAFLAELRDFIAAHCPPEALGGRGQLGSDEDDEHGHMTIPEWARRWQATLFDHGWMIPSYPPEFGGRNATPTQTLIYLEELASRGIPRSLHFGGYAIVGPSLLEFGDDSQKALAPAAIRGDTIWCIGMSEPNAGSDLASLTTRAVPDGDTFVVNGQKVWTSYAMIASKCLCYVRTDSELPKHKGISALIIDMDTPGIDIRPLPHVTGRVEFAEVFFTDVVVPRANLVGDLNGGWRITMGALAHERGGLWVDGVAMAQRTADDLIELARTTGLDGDPRIRHRVAELYAQARALRALGYKGFASFAQGSSAPEHSFMKVAAVELRGEMCELGMEMQGPFGAAMGAESAGGGRWQHTFIVNLAGKIGGGTSEIQRNTIAQRVLGLPRG